MTRSPSLPARVAAVAILTGLTLVNTIALQRPAQGVGRRVTTVNGRSAAAGEVLVKFRRELASFERGQFNQQTDADENHIVGGTGVRRIHSRQYDTVTLLDFMRSHPDVEYAEPNYIVQADAVPNDQFFNQMWWFLNNGSQPLAAPGTPGADIGATSAWDISTGSRANVVAVTDTGIDYTHPDLAANVWSALAPFTVTINGVVIHCPAGTHGFNAITNSCGVADVWDDNGHGTHVSGTIGAVGNNGVGVTGVNWTASIMASKFLGADGTGTAANAINAIEFVIQANAATTANVRVLSNSWSIGGFSQALLDEINKAGTSPNKMLFVASAGNNGGGGQNSVGWNIDTAGQQNYPASFNTSNMISVAASDNRDTLAVFSNYGATTVHLAAPGVNILSTYIDPVSGADTYQFLSGTSMAAPQVAGAAALVLSRCALDTTALKNNLLTSVDPIPLMTGKLVTGGRLNVNTAIRACAVDFSLAAAPVTQTVTSAAPASYTVTVTPTGTFGGSVGFTVSGLPSGAAANFVPPSVTTSGTSTMTVTATGATPIGNYPLTITGTSGSLSHTAPVTLNVRLASSTTVTSTNTPSTYGAPVTFTATVSGSSVPTGSATFMDGTTPLGTVPLDVSGRATLQTISLVAGTHAITAVYAGGSTFAASTSSILSQVVNPAPLTVTATNRTKTYGQTVTFAGTEFTTAGLLNGDTLTNVVLTSNGSASTASVAGPHPIVPSVATGTGLGNYTIGYVNGTLTVTPAALTVTANDRTKTYGQTVTFAGTEFTTAGLLNADAVTSVTLTSGGAAATASVAGSPYQIAPSVATGTGLANYTIGYVNGTLTVTPAALTVTANIQTRTYGAANPALTVSYSGFVNGDTAASLTVQPTVTTTATAASPVGTYPITASGATSANYTFAYVSGTLTVTPAALTVTANNQTKVYGTANPPLTVSYSGFVNGDSAASLTSPPTVSTTATSTSAVGMYSITASGAAGANYTISYVAGTLTVTPAALTVTANNQTRAYGAANPLLTVTYVGFVNGDTAASLTVQPTITTTATAASLVGTYPITPSGATSANYTFSYVSGTLTVTKVTLTVTAANQTKAYGAANPTLTVSYSGFVNGDTAASLTTPPTVSTTATTASAPGTYPITPSGATSANYTFTYVNGTLTVTTATLTVTAGDATRAYGTANPAFTVSYSGFANGDTAAILATPATASTTATAASAAGTYPITASGATSANYTFTYVSGTLTVTPAALTVTANSQTKAYGAANPALTVTYSGFVNGDTAASLTTPPSVSTTATAGSAAGTYPITATGAMSANYTISYVPGTLTVAKATLTVTAANLSKAYGAANPTLTVSYSGFVNGDTAASLTTPPTVSTTATTASAPGTYPITPSGATSANYTFTYVNGTLTVTTATLTVTAGDATRAYGTANPAFTVSYSGFANGDTAAILTTPATASTTATAASAPATYPITASGATSANYTFTYVSGTLTVTPAALTVTANSQTKTYGAANPALTVAYSGFVNGDTAASLTTPPSVSTTATAGSAAGTYPITPSGAVSANYTISYVPGTLTVAKATLTVTATSQTKAYGAANPTLTVSYSGFVNGDTAASLTNAPTVSTTATTASAPGTYPITPSGATSANYTFTYVNGTLTVSIATVTVTADHQAKTYGAANPALTVSYTGFANGDTAAILTTPATASTTATAASTPGTYPIAASGATSANYTFTYVDGTLTVTPAALTVTANDQSRVYGAANPPLTVSYIGFVNGDTAASLTTPPTVSTTATAASVPGTYPITASGAMSANYTITSVPGTLTVVANTAPSFTKGADQTVLEDVGPKTIAGWATAMSAGAGPGEATQQLTFLVMNSNPLLFAAQPAIAANGTLSFTPAANANGSATVTVQLHDDGGTAGGGVDTSAPQTFIVTVTPVNDAPSFTRGADQIVLEDAGPQTVPGWATAISAGPPNESGQTLSFTTGTTNSTLFSAQPAVSASGTLTYRPAPNTSGSATVMVQLHDDGGTAYGGVDTSAVQTFTIAVTAVNHAPVASDQSVAATEDTPLPITLTALDIDSPTLTYRIVAGPSHGTLTGTPPTVTYTPAPNYNGPDTFTFSANDGSLESNTATVSITIAAVNDAPVALDDSYSTNEGTPLTIAAPGVLTNDTDVDSPTLTVTLVSAPTQGTLTLNPDGSFLYTPTAHVNGSDRFTYTVSDGALVSNVATATITIHAVNDAPVALDDQYLTAEDTPLTIAAPGVLANDTDVDSTTLTASLVTGPAHGTLTLNLDGSFVYTPAADFNGTDTFTYHTGDGSLESNPATVTIAVTAVADAPVATPDTYGTNEDGVLSVAAPGVLANDADVDGAPLTAVLVAGPSHGTLTLDPTGSFTYTPAANFNGSDSFTYTATDGTLLSNVATVAIVVNAVNDAPVAVADSYTTHEDTPLTIAAPGVLANDTDVDSPTLTAVLVAGPTHGTLILQPDGSFVYTPAVRYSGPDGFTYTANDGSLASNIATVTLTVVAVNHAPVATDQSVPAIEDTPVAITLTASDEDAPTTLTYRIVAGPSRGTLTGTPPLVTYAPAPNANGPDSFTFVANDGSLDSNTATVSISVAAVNDAPVASDQSVAATEDTPLPITLTALDIDSPTLTYRIVAGPSHGTLTGTPPTVTYTPAPDYNGPDTFTFSANDGSLESNTATVSITIAAVNDAPIAVDDSYSTNEGTPLTIAAPGVLTNDTDVDSPTLTATLVTGPGHGTLVLNPDGSFLYTPTAHVNGSDRFTYTVSDGTLVSNVATATITIHAVNDAPVALDDQYLTAEDTPLTIAAPGVLANDTDVDSTTLTASLVTGPAHGTLTLNPDGSFVYTPAADFNGPDTFTYHTGDGSLESNPATVTITVSAVADAPVATPDTYGTNEDGVLSVAAPGVLANDADVDGAPLTAVLVAGPSHGTLTLDPAGSFTYTPAANFNGSDSFTYTATDGTLLSNVATVAIVVNAVNDAPVAGNDSYSTHEDTPLTVAAPGVLANDTDVDSPTLTAVLVAGPTHGTLILQADGSFVYTPAVRYSGPDGFTYTANDGSLASNIATVTLTVVAVNHAPVATDQSVPAIEDTPVAITLTASDEDAPTTLTYRIVAGPSRGSLTGTPPLVTYAPAPNANGPDSFTFVANDGSLDSNTATVSISVAAVNDAPVADDQSVAATEDTPLPITLTALDIDSPTLTYRIVAGPSHGTLTGTPPTVTYTPAPNYNGPDTFTFSANDGSLESNTATVSITIAAVNDAPVALDDSYSTNEGTPLTIAAPGVLTNDTDVDSPTLTVTLVSAPTQGTLTLNPDGSFLYTPTAHVNGSDRFTYTVSDGALVSNVATATITIHAVNDAPVALDDQYLTAEDTPLTIAAPGVLANDTDVDSTTLTASLVTGPAHGTLTLNLDGSFVYTPAADFNGTDTFTYHTGDGSLESNPATVTIAVTAVADAPVATPDTYGTNEDGVLSVAAPGVLANDADVDGAPLTAVLVAGPSHGTLTLDPTGSFTYTPAANFNGSDSFTYTATDGTLLSNVATVAIVVNAVNDAPVAVADSYTTHEDTPLTIAAPGVLANDTDVDSPTLTAVLVAGPTHGTLILQPDGSFVYTPAVRYSGPDGFTYTANDGSLASNIATVTLTVVAVNHAPVATDQSVPAIEDTPVAITLTASDEDAPTTLTYRIVAGPSRGTLTGTPPLVTYAPAPNANGPDSFTFVANDGSLDSNTATVSISVAAVNDAPVADDQSVAATEDTPVVITLTATDVDSPTLTYRIVDGPSNGTLAGTAPALTYTPGPSYNGADSFTFTANDGSLDSNLATVTIAIAAPNEAPLADDQVVTTIEGTATVIELMAIDPEGSPLTYAILTPPLHGALSGTAPTLTYTPEADFFGSDSFTFTANDGSVDSNEAEVVILVGVVNAAPVAVNDSYTINEDTLLTIAAPGVMQNDTDVGGVIDHFPDVDDALHVEIVAGPAHGTLTLNWDGSFAYAPAINFNGNDAFTYKVSDDSLESNTATVALTISALTGTPMAVADNYLTSVNHALTIAAPGVRGNDTNVDGATLATVLVTGPAHGTLNLNADGSFTYTPAADFSGTDTFTYKNGDDSFESNVTTATIAVAAVNGPVATNDTYSTNAYGILGIVAPGVLVNDADVAGTTLGAALISQPGHGTLTLSANGAFTYAPESGFSGIDSFTYTATNGILDSNVATVAIIVNAVNGPPVAMDDSYATGENTPLTIPAPGVLANDRDLASAAMAAVLVSPPASGTLTLNPNGGFTYTPLANFNGTDSFTYVEDGSGLASKVATVTIAVAAATMNHAPVAADQVVAANENTATSITLVATDAEGSPLTYTIVTPPAHGTLDGIAPTLTYTPAADYSGGDGFSFTANDGDLESNLAAIAITIQPANGAPVAANDSYTTDEDTPLTVAAPGVLGNDSGAYGDATAGSIVLAWDPSTEPGVTGYVVHYGSAPASHINDVDVGNVTVWATPGLTAGQQYYFTVTAYDWTGQPSPASDEVSGVAQPVSGIDSTTITATLVAAPTHGTLTLDASGSFTYTPAANYNGSDSFTYTANVGGLTSNVATAAIVVNAVNDAPVAVEDSYATSEDAPLTIPAPGVLGNDTDVDSPTLTAVLVGGPAHGTLSLHADGGFTYTPAANYNGADSFTYTANDGSLNSNVATVTLAIAAVNDAPSFAGGADQSVRQDAGAQTVVDWATAISAGPADESAQTLTFLLSNSNTSLFSGQPAVSPAGTLTFAPAAGATGVATVTVLLHDDGGVAGGGVDTSAPQTFVITVLPKLTPTVTVTGGSFIYDGAAHRATATATTDSAAPVSGTFSIAYTPGGTSAPTSAGSYAVTATFTSGDPNYADAIGTGTVTIAPATLTVTVASASRIYGNPNPTFSVTYAGFVNEETAASLTTAPTVSTTATTASAIGSYSISAGGAAGANYAIGYVNGTLTVTPAVLTVTATNETKTYGQTTTFAGTEFTTAGLINGDTVTSLTLTSGGAAATAASGGSPYPIVPSAAIGTGLGNYTIGYVNGTLTITPAGLTVTATDQTRAYGATNPALSVSYSGFVDGDTVASLTTPAIATTTATAASPVGTYPVTASGAVSANYTISYVAGTLTVTPAMLTVTAANETKAYGAVNPALTVSYSGFVDGDTAASLTTPPSVTTTATAASAVDTYPITASGAASLNYTISYAPGTLTVTPAVLTVTAANETKTYGATNPILTVSYTGFVNGDTAASLTTPPSVTTTATAASPVGTYPITASGAVSTNYTIGYVAGSLTVTPAVLTVTATNETKAYGAVNPTLTVSYSGFVNGDTVASLATPATASTTASTTSPVGTYSITASGAVSANYTIGYVAGTLTVTPAVLTVTATNETKAYGAVNPTLTVSYSGFVNGDTAASLTTPATASTAATTASPVGTYPITASGAASLNYTISYVAGTLTVTPAVLTVTASNETKAYGAVNPALTLSYSGFVNGDTAASLTTAPTVSTMATMASAVGTYPITATGAVSANYTISYVAGTLTVTPAVLTVTAANETKAYGAVNPTLTVSYSGFVNGDTAASLATPATASTTASTTSAVGSYPITASGAVSTNYTISYVAGTLTVTPAVLTVTAANETKAYGAVNPTLTVSYSGFVNGDTAATLTTPAIATTTATAGSAVGNYSITASGAASLNYTISYVAGTLTVTPVVLTVTAANETKAYGAVNPTLTVSYSGFVNGDTATSLTTPATASTTATAASPVGTYAITASGAVGPNYTISYVGGSLTVTPAVLTVTAANETKAYGAVNPTLTVSYSGFVNGDTATSLTTPATASTTATAASPVGTYAITATGAVSTNYTVSYVAGSLTVTPAVLTVTAANETKAYGAANPTLTVSYSGFVNGDTAASLTTPATASTTASTTSPVGTYPITASGAVSPNYTIGYVAGTLTVTPAVLTVTAANETKAYGAVNPTLTVSYSGFVNGDTAASLATPATASTAATTASPVGTYPITATGAVSTNYTISYVAGSLTVTPAMLTVTAANETKAYGAVNPTLTVSYSGFVNGDTAASLATPATASTTATTASPVGTYPITATGAVSTNYTISYVAGSLTVTPAMLTVTAANETKAYGAVNPTLTVSYSGFVNGDTVASLATPATASTTASTTSAVGSYPITASGAVSTNYTISYVAGTLAVTPAVLTVTAANETKAYGAVNPTLTVSYSGFVNGDTVASLATPATASTAATTASPVGTYPITATGAVSTNYTVSYVAGSLTVTPAVLTVTAANETKAYGAANPTLTVSYSGFVNGDTAASLTTPPAVATTATTTSAVGSYPITASGAASLNYTISYVAGTLTVTPVVLTVTATNETKPYGAVNPTLTVSYSGFVNGDTATSLTTPAIATTTATAGSAVGNYSITASGAASLNYTISYVAGTLTVTPAVLTVTAANETKAYGAVNPALTVSYSGFVNGDTAASLTTPATASTTATTTSAVGTYPITASGAASLNYTIGYAPGTLTVTPAVLTVTAANETKAYGAVNPTLTVSYSGFVNGDTAASLTTPATASTIATTASPSGAIRSPRPVRSARTTRSVTWPAR